MSQSRKWGFQSQAKRSGALGTPGSAKTHKRLALGDISNRDVSKQDELFFEFFFSNKKPFFSS
jgi:hypothetical protein